MRASAAAAWRSVHAERRRLVADLTGLPHEQWLTPSLCPDWDVHDVVAHLVDTARTSRTSFVRDLVAARTNLDRANENGIRRAKRADPLDTLRALAQRADLTRTPPTNLATRLVEAIVHGEDARRPLGIGGTYPADDVAAALAYQLRTPVSFGGGRERAAGLRLVDRHTSTTWGTGDEVRGDTLDLLLAVSGRRVEPDLFEGPGAARLAGAASTAAPDGE